MGKQPIVMGKRGLAVFSNTAGRKLQMRQMNHLQQVTFVKVCYELRVTSFGLRLFEHSIKCLKSKN